MADSLLENYNPLYDVHLRQYFALPHMQKHLRRMGLLDSNGVPVSQNGNVESELYARHHAMMDMMLRNRERVLMQLADLQKKYDAAEKVEIYRRVRSGVTDAEEFRRNHLSRSLSRPRRSATQPVKHSGRRRHSSNSFEDTEVIKRIETTYEQPQSAQAQANIKNTYDRLSANAFKYQFLHKLDDTTLINYKDSLQKQLQKLKRFRDISFGPHNVARHQTSQPASWFFRRRSLPSLSNSAPQNSLHSPIRSLKAAKDGHEKSNGSAHGSADEHRRRQGKSQSPRRQMQADRPRPRRAASPTKRAATTHAGTRLPPIHKESTPIKPPRIQQRTAPTPQVKEEKPAGFFDKLTSGVAAAAGGVAAAAAVVGGTVAAAVGVGDNEEEHPHEEPEEMDTTEDEAPKSPSPPQSPEVAPQTPEAASSPVHVENEEDEPSLPSSHHTEVESPIPSPRHEELPAKTPSPVDVHVTEASPRQSPTEEEEQANEEYAATKPREEEHHRSPTPEEQEREVHIEHSPSASPEHEHKEVQHRSPTPERHEQQEHSPPASPQHEDVHAKSPSPIESHREEHEVEQEYTHREPAHNEDQTTSPTDHTPGRFDEAHADKAHSFHEDDLRSIENMGLVSHDIEVEDTQNARNKRGASFEAEEVLQREAEERAEEFNGVQDQSNGAGAELEHNQEEVEKLTDEHETESHHERESDIQSHRSQHEEAEHENDIHTYRSHHEEEHASDNRSLQAEHEEGEYGQEHEHNASPVASESHSISHHEEQHMQEHHEEASSPVPSHASERHIAEDVASLNQGIVHDTNEYHEQQSDTGSVHNDYHHNGHDNHAEPEHEHHDELEADQHEKQSQYAESHEGDRSERSTDFHANPMEQSIYQQHDNREADEHHSVQHEVEEHEPPASPKELLSPESPIQKAQDVMVNSFYPGAEHDEPPRLPSPDPEETVEERSHEEHVERDPIQAHEHAFEPGFIGASSHEAKHEETEHHHHEAQEEPQHYNGVQEEETLEPPISNRSLESFQRHEEEVAADIQHDHDVHNEAADNQHNYDSYNDENQEPGHNSIASPQRGHLLNQPSIEITAPSDFGDEQNDEISAPPTPHSPDVTTHNAQTYEHEVIEHPLHERENYISDEEANENSSLLANGHEGDREDQDEEDDDDDTGSVVMHKTPDSATYQQQHHQYQRSDDEQSETGRGHL